MVHHLFCCVSFLVCVHCMQGGVKAMLCGGGIPSCCRSCSQALWKAWQAGSSASWCFIKASLNLWRNCRETREWLGSSQASLPGAYSTVAKKPRRLPQHACCVHTQILKKVGGNLFITRVLLTSTSIFLQENSGQDGAGRALF